MYEERKQKLVEVVKADETDFRGILLKEITPNNSYIFFSKRATALNRHFMELVFLKTFQ